MHILFSNDVATEQLLLLEDLGLCKGEEWRGDEKERERGGKRYSDRNGCQGYVGVAMVRTEAGILGCHFHLERLVFSSSLLQHYLSPLSSLP